jgi:hypothetical protein
MAYGFRDDTYFFLKIRAAFPGVGDEPNISGLQYALSAAMSPMMG